MAVSAVVAVASGVSYEQNRKAKSEAKRTAKKAADAAEAERKRQEAAKAKQEKQEAALEAAKSSGTTAEMRIAAERSYLRRGRRGRMGTIKGNTALG